MPALHQLAVPAVCSLIAFLSYSSQYLFAHTEPGPLTRNETILFNVLIACIWFSYERACRVNPGDFRKTKGAQPARDGEKDVGLEEEIDLERIEADKELEKLVRRGQVRWCKRCNAVKPPRAHHCKKCGRCIPKMDHHCPWTANCVSHTTFPHFLRFVFYAVASMTMLEYHLYTRASHIWAQRNLPSYLGPSLPALAHLVVLIFFNSITLFALIILLVSSIHSLAINTTMIEAWEIERHQALVERSRRSGGVVYGPGGVRVRITPQEFPYDIGIWANIVQGMGSDSILVWFWPFAGGPSIETAWTWEVNGFEDEDKVWPPVDPDKLPRDWTATTVASAAKNGKGGWLGDDGEEIDRVAAFKKRQQEDLKRVEQLRRRRGGRQDEEDSAGSADESDREESPEYEIEEGLDGELGWTNSDGDRLRDYGVDEDVDDEDIPLGVLLQRRQAQNAGVSTATER